MPNNDYITRRNAINAACSDCYCCATIDEFEDTTCPVKQRFVSIPAADVVPVVRCRDCKYKPTAPEGITEGFQVEFPYEFDNPCPCQCGDGWYSQKPDDDFFCAYGAKMDAEPPKEEEDEHL